MAYPGPLAPHFVNNDYVTAEVIYSTAHACHEVVTWSRVVYGMHMWCVCDMCEVYMVCVCGTCVW